MEERMTQIEEFMALQPDLFCGRSSARSPQNQGPHKIDRGTAVKWLAEPKFHSSFDEVDRISRSPAGLRSTQLALAILRQCKHHLGKEEIGFLGRHTVQFSRCGPRRGSCGQRKTPGEEHRRALEQPGQSLAQLPEALRSLRALARGRNQSKRMPTSNSP